MLEVEVIADPAAAVSALDPIRSRLLAELSEPALDEPGEGIAVIGSCQVGDEARGMASVFFYGNDAADTAPLNSRNGRAGWPGYFSRLGIASKLPVCADCSLCSVRELSL